MEKKFYTVLDIAKELGLTRQAIHLHYKDGHLPEPQVIGKTRYWTRRQAESFISTMRAGKWPLGRRPGGKK